MEQDIKTADIAVVCYCSKSTLEKLFRCVNNISVRAYLIRRRMTLAAKALLKQPENPYRISVLVMAMAVTKRLPAHLSKYGTVTIFRLTSGARLLHCSRGFFILNFLLTYLFSYPLLYIFFSPFLVWPILVCLSFFRLSSFYPVLVCSILVCPNLFFPLWISIPL